MIEDIEDVYTMHDLMVQTINSASTASDFERLWMTLIDRRLWFLERAAAGPLRKLSIANTAVLASWDEADQLIDRRIKAHGVQHGF